LTGTLVSGDNIRCDLCHRGSKLIYTVQNQFRNKLYMTAPIYQHRLSYITID